MQAKFLPKLPALRTRLGRLGLLTVPAELSRLLFLIQRIDVFWEHDCHVPQVESHMKDSDINPFMAK
jgi:hypothetical protein